MESKNETEIDAQNCVIGRLGSKICKRLLLGEEIRLVNRNTAVILGKKSYIVKRYKDKLKNKVIKKGPYYHRSPADLVKRSFRNMLPHLNKRGVEALARLKCYNSVPSTLIKAEKQVVEISKMKDNSVLYYTKMEDLGNILGHTKSQKTFDKGGEN